MKLLPTSSCVVSFGCFYLYCGINEAQIEGLTLLGEEVTEIETKVLRVDTNLKCRNPNIDVLFAFFTVDDTACPCGSSRRKIF